MSYAAFAWALMMAAPSPPRDVTEHRFALLIGSNTGNVGEPHLRYAVSDAQQMAQVLSDLAGFDRNSIIVLADPSAQEVRRTFARLQARLRGAPNSLFVVYYSGHADGIEVHLGGSLVRWEELVELTKNSGASTQLLIADACRSGEATLLKGARVGQLFALPNQSSLPQGMAVLTSARADESAQESAELKASYFTYHLTMALRGSADTNGDGVVSLGEAYQYAAAQTAASTASTLGGIQHASFRYQLRGQNDLPLSRPSQQDALAALRLRLPGTYFVHQNTSQGLLVAELTVGRQPRTIWLTANTYVVQRRTTSAMYEGDVELNTHASAPAEPAFHAIDAEPALALKGGDAVTPGPYTLSLWGGTGGNSLPGFALPIQGSLRGSWHVRSFSLDAVLRFDHTSSQQADLLSMAALVGARWLPWSNDVWRPWLGARVGAWAGRESYTAREAPRGQLNPEGDTLAGLDVAVSTNVFFGVEGGARFLGVQSSNSGASSAVMHFAVVPTVSLGFGLRL